jgi:hypothetical protein
LLLEVAREMGAAYMGAAGDEVSQIPIDAYDLSECKRHVNNGLRKFFADAPPTGWRFARPVQTIDLWGAVGVVAGTTVTSVTDSGVTTMTATAASFCESMELKIIVVTDADGSDDIMITKVLSSTKAEINRGDNSDFSASTYSIANNGNYTMPPHFAGMMTGTPTYVTNSNQGVSLSWVGEALIRQYRENITDETGDPFYLATRTMNVDGLGNPLNGRRWELMAYPRSSGTESVEFPMELHFDKLENLADLPPVPIVHDETLKAACLAVVERDVHDRPGRHWQDYHENALPRSHTLDARTGPRALGYFGDPSVGRPSIQQWRQTGYDRPAVTGDNIT